ncbi:MAG: hypothetical protein ACR2LF_08460 [Jatrophihabitantaceae bacterium]
MRLSDLIAGTPWLRDRIHAARARDDADASEDGIAVARIERIRKAAVDPQVSYRCECRCLLLAAWNTPSDVLIWHPTFHLPDARRDKHGARELDDARLHWSDQYMRRGRARRVFAPRGYAWAGKPVFVACEHQWQPVDPERFRSDLASALKFGRTVEVIFRVSSPDTPSHE